jgi:hypothetical protein
VDVAAANHAPPMVAARLVASLAAGPANSGYFLSVTLTFEPTGSYPGARTS